MRRIESNPAARSRISPRELLAVRLYPIGPLFQQLMLDEQDYAPRRTVSS